MNQSDDQNLIGIILLAAGASRRMGQPKQLLLIDQQSLIKRSIQTALETNRQSILVVLGANAAQIHPEIKDLSVKTIHNDQWEEGMGSSIHKGVQEILRVYPNLQAIIIMVCDQPLLNAGQLDELIRLYETNHSRLVASEYANTLGVPALFDKSLFPELLTLSGQVGARKMIQKYKDQLDKVSFPEGKIDLDTPSDYKRFLENYASNTLG